MDRLPCCVLQFASVFFRSTGESQASLKRKSPQNTFGRAQCCKCSPLTHQRGTQWWGFPCHCCCLFHWYSACQPHLFKNSHQQLSVHEGKFVCCSTQILACLYHFGCVFGLIQRLVLRVSSRLWNCALLSRTAPSVTCYFVFFLI